MTTANVSRLVTEALVAGTPTAQVSKVAVEALYIGNPQPQISRMAVEVLYTIPGTTGTVAGAASSPTATLSGPPSSAYPTAVLADAPAGYWRLGEASGVGVALDTSGNWRTGSYNGTPIRGATGLLVGDTDTAVTFQGSGNNQYVNVPSASWMQVTTVTVEFLFSTSVPGNSQTLMSRDLTGSNGPWRLDLSGSKLNWYVWAPGFVQVSGTTTIVANKTYHVAATYDGTTSRLYLNGVLEASTTGGTGLTTTQNQPLMIGAYGSGSNFNGTIDEAAFYTTALSATRVAAHAAATGAATLSGAVPSPTAALTGTVTAAANITGVVTGAVASPTATAAGATTYAGQVLSDHPLGYWRLGDKASYAADVGTGALQTTSSGVTYQAAGPLPSSLGAVLDGTIGRFTTNVNIAHSKFSIEAWIKTTDANGVIASNRDAGGDSLTLLVGSAPIGGAAGKLSLGFDGPSLWIGVTSANTYNDGNWHHVVGVWDGTAGTGVAASQLSLYVDGVAVSTTATGVAGSRTAPLTGTTGYAWGKDGAGIGAGYLAGTLSRVALYGSALSATRIAAHYAATSTAAYRAAVVTDTPLAEWDLEYATGNTAYADSSGQSHPMTPAGGTAPSATGLLAGDTDGAADFNGTTNYGQAGYATWLDSSDVTVEAIINADSVTADHAILARHNAAAGKWDFCVADGKLRFRTATSGFASVLSATTILVGTTYHVAAVYNGTTGVATVYVNGVADGTATLTAGANGATSGVGLYLGALGHPTLYFDGRLDEVAFYGSILTSTRIAAHSSAVGITSALTGTLSGAVASPTAALAGTATPPVFAGTLAGAVSSPTATLSGSVATYASTVLADTPAAYWRLGEATSGGGAADASGHGYTGTYSNPPTLGQPSLVGDTNTSAKFNGTSTSIDTPTIARGSSGYVTAEALVKLNGLGKTQHVYARANEFSGTNRLFKLLVSSTNHAEFHIWSGSSWVIATGSTTLTTGVVYHLAGRLDGTNLKVYVNGVLDGTFAYVGTLAAQTAGGLIGAGFNGVLYAFFDGWIDEVADYDVALSDARIAAHAAVAGVAVALFSGTVTGVVSSPTGALVGTRALPTSTGVLAGAVASPTASVTGTVTAPNVAPTANFTWTPGSVPGEVVFDGLSSSDPDGSIVNFAWDFGNGQTVSGVPSDWSGATVEYGSTPGSYQVHLTVTDNKGATGTVTKTVTIAAPSVTGTLTGAAPSPTATLTGPTAATGVLAGVVPRATGTIAGVVSARPARPDDWPGTSVQLDSDYTFDSEDTDSTGASLEDGEPVPAGYGRTFWWYLTPADSATMSFDLLDSAPVDFTPVVDPDTDEESEPPAVDVKVAVYTGTSVGNMQLVAAGGQSGVEVALAAGVTYYAQASLRTGAADVMYQLSVGAPIDTDRYVMDLEVLSPVLRAAPTSVTVAVAGGPPNDEVTFEIDGVVTDSATLDEDGSLEANSVNVPDGYGAGDHVVSVHSGSSSLAGEGAFTLQRGPYQSQQTVGGDRPPVDIPSANTSTGVRRWIFQDLMAGGEGSYVLPRNPSEMSSPQYQRQLSQAHTTAVDGGQYHLNSIARTTVEWTFNGYLESQAEVERFQAYYGLKRRFYVIDHRSRAWIVTFLSLELTPRKRQREDDGDWNDWAHDYKVTALIYDQDWSEPT